MECAETKEDTLLLIDDISSELKNETFETSKHVCKQSTTFISKCLDEFTTIQSYSSNELFKINILAMFKCMNKADI